MSVNIKYITLIITGCVFLLSIIFSGAINSAIDFAPLYYSSQILSEGGNIYDFDLLKEIIVNHGHDSTAVHYLYPPFLSSLIQPLGHLSLTIALTIWLILNTTALIIGFGLLLKYFLPDHLLYYLFSLIGLLLFYPVSDNLFLGQVNPIIFLLLSGGLFLLLKNKKVGTGIFLGLASLIKIFPIVFLLHSLFLKKWKIFCSGIITILVGILITIILAGQAGLTNTIEYFSQVLPNILSGNLTGWAPGNSSPGNLDVLWTSGIYVNIISYLTKIILTIFFLFIGYKYLFKKQKIDPISIALEFSFLTTLMVISSAFSFHHYLIWLIIPLILLFNIYLKNKNKLLLTFLIVAFIFSAIPPILTKIFIQDISNQNIYPLINPGLWAVIIILGLLICQYFKKNNLKIKQSQFPYTTAF